MIKIDHFPSCPDQNFLFLSISACYCLTLDPTSLNFYIGLSPSLEITVRTSDTLGAFIPKLF